MWARWSEAALGGWLAASALVLPNAGAVEVAAGLAVLVLAVLSARTPHRHLHLAEFVPVVVLLVHGWLRTRGTAHPDAASQSAIVTALLIATFAVVPDRPATPPPAWRGER